MEAPQKRARDEVAATERPNKKYKCDPSLDTAAKQQDLSALSKPELRALVAQVHAMPLAGIAPPVIDAFGPLEGAARLLRRPLSPPWPATSATGEA